MTRPSRSVVIRLIVAGCMIVAATACGGWRGGSGFPLPVLTDIEGRTIHATTFAGKIVVVNFWATWCGPCEEEFPSLVTLQARHHEEVQVIGLALDDAPLGTIRAFAARHQANFPIVMADASTAELFGGIMGLPTTLIADRAGTIRERHLGFATLDVLEALVARHLSR